MIKALTKRITPYKLVVNDSMINLNGISQEIKGFSKIFFGKKNLLKNAAKLSQKKRISLIDCANLKNLKIVTAEYHPVYFEKVGISKRYGIPFKYF